jgi:DNA-binding MarR family transcriptional regulator
VTKKEYEILAAFRYELRKFLHFSEKAAHEHALTPQKYQALLAIQGSVDREEMTVGELAEQLQVAPHSAVGLVDRLQRDGLIRRQASSEDRRRVHVKLTARGKKALEKLASVHHQELQNVGPQLVQLLARLTRSQAPARKPAAEANRIAAERRPNASPVCYSPEITD